MQETQIQFLGQENPLKKEMASHSSILAWETPWTEEPGRLQSMRLQRVVHSYSTTTTTKKPNPLGVCRLISVQCDGHRDHGNNCCSGVNKAANLLQSFLHDESPHSRELASVCSFYLMTHDTIGTKPLLLGLM